MTENKLLEEVETQIEKIVEDFCSDGKAHEADTKLMNLKELLWCVGGSDELRNSIDKIRSKVAYIAIQQREERNKLFK